MKPTSVRTLGRAAVALAVAAVTAGCSPTPHPMAGITTAADTASPTSAESPERPLGSLATAASSQPAVSPTTSGSANGPTVQGQHTDSGSQPPITPQPGTSSNAVRSTSPAAIPRIVAAPRLGSAGISPTTPLTIHVTGGTIRSLSFTNPAEGVQVEGFLSADRTTWTLAEALGYGKTYTVQGVAAGADGTTTPITGNYSTIRPETTLSTSISPGDNAVVGVAAPIIIRFSSPPTDRALIEKHITISTTSPVVGAWAWVTHDGDTYPSLDFRPKTYWPENTRVHVETDLYGVRLGDRLYGGDNTAVDFTIGRNQVVIANATSKKIVVQRDGKVVAAYPASYGMGDDPRSKFGINPDLVTRSGIHIVMDKKPKVLMSLPEYGYTNIPEYWDVRISDNGEFIHENPATVADQGFLNVTHGCINLSPDNAKSYYNSAIYGDPVEVSGTSVKLSPEDGDIFDWAVSWPVWTSLSSRGQFTTSRL